MCPTGRRTKCSQHDASIPPAEAGRPAGRPEIGSSAQQKAGYLSEHDVLIGRKLAYVLCGSDLSRTTEVREEYLLELEREAFLSLCGHPKTQDRIRQLLETGKPLRN